jgi:hypothetical protein
LRLEFLDSCVQSVIGAGVVDRQAADSGDDERDIEVMLFVLRKGLAGDFDESERFAAVDDL